jgi:arsenate reductase
MPDRIPDTLATSDAIAALAALAQPWRLETYRLLARYLPYGLPAGDIARLVAVPHNTMSTHLQALEQAALVTSRREGRSIIYAANRARMLQLTAFLLKDCARSPAPFADLLASAPHPFPARREISMTHNPANVLILCTGNSARSILAEAILNREGAGRFRAYSAGSQPKGEPNPHALSLLKELGYETASFRSKSWDEFATPGAPAMDFIFTVCDSAAGEACPVWLGHPVTAHWGIEDPAAVEGTDLMKEAAFERAFRFMHNRISAFLALPIVGLDKMTLGSKLREIGALEGRSAGQEG